MKTVKLLVPFSLPLLGEAFIDIGNPALVSTINFFTEIGITFDEYPKAHTPLSSLSLKRIVEDHLNARGERKIFHVNPPHQDFLTLTSILYLIGSDSLQDYAPLFISKLSGKPLMTMVRALTAISGGFVVCRKGEGLVSLNGNPEASVLLSIKPHGKSMSGVIRNFHETFPDLSQPLWHTIGHIVVEGSKAIRENDPKKLGYLMTLESSIGCAIGLLKPRDLVRLSRVKDAYGSKMITLEDAKGELILSPKETSTWGNYQRFSFTSTGVSEVEYG